MTRYRDEVANAYFPSLPSSPTRGNPFSLLCVLCVSFFNSALMELFSFSIPSILLFTSIRYSKFAKKNKDIYNLNLCLNGKAQKCSRNHSNKLKKNNIHGSIANGS